MCLESNVCLKKAQGYVNVIFIIFVHCNLDSGRQDGPCEVGHVDAQEVTHFLRSCGDKRKRGGGVGNSMQTKRERAKLGANECCSTGVVGHGRLVRVALLLEGHVPQLKHGRHHLQETCWTEGLSLSSSSPHLRTPMATHHIKTKSLVPILSSSGMLMM